MLAAADVSQHLYETECERYCSCIKWSMMLQDCSEDEAAAQKPVLMLGLLCRC